MSFGVKLILNIKKHQNLTILPKNSINFYETQQISKKTQANSKKTQANPKKTQCTGGKCLPDPPKKREKKAWIKQCVFDSHLPVNDGYIYKFI